MIIQYSLLLLGLVVGFQSHEICNFEHHLCKWYNLYQCHFHQETRKSLADEKGYLFISKNTCKKAGIYFRIEKSIHKFQLHYFINGTGGGKLAVSANYLISGRYNVWTCNLNQGPSWNKADILVKKEGIFDWLRYIAIEAIVYGDTTVAIGNISSTYEGHIMAKCPRLRITNKPKTRKTTIRKPTNNAPKTTTVLQTTSSIITSSSDPKTHHSIRLTTNGAKAPNITLSQVITTEPVGSQSLVSTPEKATVTSQDKRKPTESSLSNSYVSMTVEQTSDQSDEKNTNAIPAVTVTARNHPNPTTTTGHQQSTLLQDVKTLKSVSDGIINEKQQSSKLKQKKLIIGLSTFAAVFVIAVVIVISFFIYKRKIKIWDVQKSTKPINGFQNPLFH